MKTRMPRMKNDPAKQRFVTTVNITMLQVYISQLVILGCRKTPVCEVDSFRIAGDSVQNFHIRPACLRNSAHSDSAISGESVRRKSESD
jgi:hypothetical protein